MIKVCLDAGHGGSDVGAVGVKGCEYKYNMQVVELICKYLEGFNCEVVTTRNHNGEYVGLTTRANISNNSNCDLFVSIHCNAFNGKAFGFESYSYTKNKYQEQIHKSVLETIVIKDRGMKENKKFTVLSKTKCKAVLLELCFIDNKQDEDILINNIENYSMAITKGIVVSLGLTPKTEPCHCKCHKK